MILLTYLSTAVLKGEKGKSSSSINPNTLSIAMLAVQAVMFVYLFYISIFKLLAMLGQATREARTELALIEDQNAKNASEDWSEFSAEECAAFKACCCPPAPHTLFSSIAVKKAPDPTTTTPTTVSTGGLRELRRGWQWHD